MRLIHLKTAAAMLAAAARWGGSRSDSNESLRDVEVEQIIMLNICSLLVSPKSFKTEGPWLCHAAALPLTADRLGGLYASDRTRDAHVEEDPAAFTVCNLINSKV